MDGWMAGDGWMDESMMVMMMTLVMVDRWMDDGG